MVNQSALAALVLTVVLGMFCECIRSRKLHKSAHLCSHKLHAYTQQGQGDGATGDIALDGTRITAEGEDGMLTMYGCGGWYSFVVASI